ncbi:MAG: DUF3891 family protein [Balneolales bacterium]
MIVAPENDHVRLITQPAHAWISGQIAAQWGANGFLRPEPWSDLCFAAANHDAGWIPWELNPQLNAETGYPYDFRNIPIADHFDIWEASPRRTALTSRYSALLVSHHVAGLFRMHDFTEDPAVLRDKARVFIREQEHLQDGLKQSLISDGFYHRFMEAGDAVTHQRLTSVFDYLSLILCMGSVQDEIIGKVPHASGDIPVSIKKSSEDELTYLMDPWPFHSREVHVHCDARILTSRYSSQQALTDAIQQAGGITFHAKLTKNGFDKKI